MPVAIRDTKVRGFHQVYPTLWHELDSTSAVNNKIYNEICKELVAIKNGKASHLYNQPGDKEALSALIEVILEMPNKSANFALTRLVGNDSWQTLEGTVKEINKAKESLEKERQRVSISLEKLDESKKGAKEKQAQYQERLKLLDERIPKFELALKCFKRVENNSWAPLRDLFTRELTLAEGSFRISDLETRLVDVRPLFNEAVQALKSNYRLQEEYPEKIAAWNAKKEALEQEPLWVLYKELQYVIPKKLTPEAWVSFLDTHKTTIEKSLHFAISLPDNHRTSAESASQESDPKSRKPSFWRGKLFKLNPELKELYDFHQKVQGIFGKAPKKPEFTLPDPINHPRAIIWERAQVGEIRLSQDGKTMDVELPLSVIQDGKLTIKKTWVSVSGDPRLVNGTRLRNGQLEYQDKVTGDWFPFEFGGIRLQIRAKGNHQDYRLIFTQKTKDSALPDWVSNFKNHEILPQNFIAVSFVHDPKNQGILKISKISGTEFYVIDPHSEELVKVEERDLPDLQTGGERRFSFPKQQKLIELELPNVEVAGAGTLRLTSEAAKTHEVMRHRSRAQMLQENKELNVAKIQNLEEELSELITKSGFTREKLRKLSDSKKALEKKPKAEREALPDDFPLELVRKFDDLNQRIRVARKNTDERIEGNWGKVRNKGEDRVQVIAGAVVRVIEQLRAKYPGYDIALVLPEEAAHKPKKIYSGHTNQQRMASQEGALYLKIVQMAEGRPNPIPVFRVYDFGLDEVSPTSGTVLKVTWHKDRKTFRAPEATHEPLRVFFVQKKDNGGYSINEEPSGPYGLKGSNSLRVFADNRIKPSSASVKLNAQSAAGLLQDPTFVDELNRRFGR